MMELFVKVAGRGEEGKNPGFVLCMNYATVGGENSIN